VGLLRRWFGSGAGQSERTGSGDLELGLALLSQRRAEDAIEPLRIALEANQDPARAATALAEAFAALGDDAQADYFVARALEIDPGFAPAHFQQGVFHQLTGRFDAAALSYGEALRLAPDFAPAWLNLGLVHERRGDFPAALAHHARAAGLRPDWAEAHFNLSLQLLLQGDYARGWEEYEWRWRRLDLEGYAPHAAKPRWDGGATRQTVLVYCEQGFGDSLLCLRFVPLVRARAGRVLLECPPKLAPLFRNTPGIDAVIARGEPLPAFDSCCALLGLPRLLGTTVANLPAAVPYVQADPDRVRHWAVRLAGDRGLKVGLFWATDSASRITEQRSLELNQLAPLGTIQGVSFYSLQRGAPARQACAPPAGMRIVDLSAELSDFADDAALMANLDLVISVDTATAHLAGALGRPVWVMTSFPPHWVWMLQRADSPWYPSLRLFRQARPGDWPPVIEQVAAALAARLRK
jgi:Tfp pilus assembly protein PilF